MRKVLVASKAKSVPPVEPPGAAAAAKLAEAMEAVEEAQRQEEAAAAEALAEAKQQPQPQQPPEDSEAIAGAGEGVDAAAGALVVHPDNDTEQAMWDWLENLDGGRGTLLQYFGAIKSEFDADFTQISAARLTTPWCPGTLGSIEPSFFEALTVTRVGHKLMLAKGILALP